MMCYEYMENFGEIGTAEILGSETQTLLLSKIRQLTGFFYGRKNGSFINETIFFLQPNKDLTNPCTYHIVTRFKS